MRVPLPVLILFCAFAFGWYLLIGELRGRKLTRPGRARDGRGKPSAR